MFTKNAFPSAYPHISNNQSNIEEPFSGLFKSRFINEEHFIDEIYSIILPMYTTATESHNNSYIQVHTTISLTSTPR